MRDKDLRNAVRCHLQALHRGDQSTRIVEEMGVWSGTVRIDIAVINGELSGFELKSAKDTLERLELQADLYSRVFDQVTLVVASRHSEKAYSMIPAWWGVMCATDVDGTIQLTTKRGAIRNPSPEPYLVAELLRKDEAIAVLEECHLAGGWKSKPMKAIHERLADELPFSVLSECVRAKLKSRKEWLGQHRVD